MRILLTETELERGDALVERFDDFMPEDRETGFLREEDFDLIFEDIFENEYDSLYDDSEEITEI